MASKFKISSGTRFLLAVTTILCLVESLRCVRCSEFEVGERTGWVVPLANDTEMYNEWASGKRFKIGDTIIFKYKKDSVMEVSKQDYEECNSNRPGFFSNSGKTVFTLDRSGFFYFISGAMGHCDKGQRMIVWVIAQEGPGGTSSHAPNINAFFISYIYGLFVIIAAAFHLVYLH